MAGASRSQGKQVPVDPNAWLEEQGIFEAAAISRATGDWSSLTADHFRRVKGFNSVTRQVAGRPGQWYQSLVVLGAVTPDEEKLIRAVSKSKGSVQGALEKGAIPEEKLQAWADNTLKPIIQSCRKTGNWSPLAARHFEDHDYFKPFYSRIGNGKYWYEGLVGAALITKEEAELVRKQARKDSGAAIKEKAKEVYSISELQSWIDDELPQIIHEAIRTDQLLTLSRGEMNESHRIAEFAQRRIGETSSWFQFLKEHAGVTDKVIAGIQAAVKAEQGSRLREQRCKYSKAQIEKWFCEKVAPDLVCARKEGDFSRLVLRNWYDDDHFGSFTAWFGTRAADWYGALKKIAGLTDEEESAIRQAGNEQSSRRISCARQEMLRLERSLTVVEKLVQSPSSGEALTFAEIAARLHEASYPINFQPVGREKGFHVVIETAVASQEQSAAEVFRLALGGTRTPQKWNECAESFVAVEKALSGYLTNRLGFLHLADLAISQQIRWPRKALSVCSGDGALYRISSEFEGELRKMHLEPLEVTDVDFSDEMLRLNPNTRKHRADASNPLPEELRGFDLFECSCPHRVKDVRTLIKNASQALSIGGVLLMKVENLYFSDDFKDGLTAAGFKVIGDVNMQAVLPDGLLEGLPEGVVEKARGACRKTHFVFAEKVSDDFQARHGSFTFVRRLNPDAEVDRAQALLRARLHCKNDSEYLEWIDALKDFVTTISDEAFRQKQRLLIGLLKHAMKVVYEREIKEQAPGLEVRMVPILQGMIEADLERLKAAEPDPVSEYLTALVAIARALNHRERAT